MQRIEIETSKLAFLLCFFDRWKEKNNNENKLGCLVIIWCLPFTNFWYPRNNWQRVKIQNSVLNRYVFLVVMFENYK